MLNPKVSVILGTFNHMTLLPIAIKSILDQTFHDFEFIIINDGSTDETQKYLDSLNDPRIRLFRHDKNLGIIETYNEGVLIAKSEYITWISSDNYHLSTFLERLVQALDTNPEAVFAYSAFHWVNKDAKIIRTNYEQYLGPHALLMDNPGIASFMYRKDIHKEIGYYDNIGIASDTDFWVRLMEKYGDRIVYVPKVLVYFLWDTNVDSFRRFPETEESIKKMVERTKDRRRKNRVISGRAPHILFLVPNFVPDWYAGVETYTYNLAKALISKGFKVSVAVPKVGPPGIIQKNYNGIDVFHLVADFDPIDMRKGIGNKGMEDQYIRLLDSNQFDIIHFHHAWGFPTSLIWFTKKTGYPLCITLHDFYFICHKFYLQDWKGNIDNGPESVDQCVECAIGDKEIDIDEVASHYYIISYRQLNNRLLLDKADVLTCSSKYVKNVFTSRGFGKKMEISELGIVPVQRLPARTKKFTFGYFGVINPIKRVDDLIKVFKGIKNEDIELIIWGQGQVEYIEALRDLIREDKGVSYRGPYTQDQLPRMLSEIDVFINPSLNESFSFTIREALSGGVPVIARDVGAIPEIIIDESVGYLFENLEELENCMSISMIDPKYRVPEIVTEGIRTIKEDADGWIRRYKRLL